MPIPQRIIQTGKSRQLPPLAKAAAVNLQLLHPTWEYRFFDDRQVVEFIEAEFPQYKAVFDGFPYKIQRFDFFRYLAVFRLGGFYFDLDVFLSEKLDPLLLKQSVFPFEELTLNRHLREAHQMDWEVGNYAFAAAPNDPYLGLVIENCVRGQKDPDWVRPMMRGIPRLFQADFHVLNTTGPGVLSRTLAENPKVAQSVTVLFPPDVRDEEHWHQFGTYGIHAMEGSWRTKGNFLRRRLARAWENRLRARLMRESAGAGAVRG